MPWFNKKKLSFLETTVIKILKTGSIPRHVAFIMDGNRRFARKKKFKSVAKGHAQGFDQLQQVSRTSDLFSHGITYVLQFMSRSFTGVKTWELKRLLSMPLV